MNNTGTLPGPLAVRGRGIEVREAFEFGTTAFHCLTLHRALSLSFLVTRKVMVMPVSWDCFGN